MNTEKSDELGNCALALKWWWRWKQDILFKKTRHKEYSIKRKVLSFWIVILILSY